MTEFMGFCLDYYDRMHTFGRLTRKSSIPFSCQVIFNLHVKPVIYTIIVEFYGIFPNINEPMKKVVGRKKHTQNTETNFIS
jgi:hypothetical protein